MPWQLKNQLKAHKLPSLGSKIVCLTPWLKASRILASFKFFQDSPMSSKFLCHFLVFGLLIGLAQSSAASSGSSASDAYIKVRSSKVRSAPQPWAPSIASVQYGDRVTLLDSSGSSWASVKTAGGKQGFLSISAITPQKVVLSAQAATPGADSSEVVLAGKGFSKSVEKEFAASDQHANFAAVNRMEALKVGEGEVLSFAKAGKLAVNG